MKGELVLIDTIEDEIFEFDINPSSYDFSLSVYVDEEKTLEKQLKNIDNFNKCISFMRKIGDNEYNFYKEQDKEINYIQNNLENILDSVEYIRFDFQKEDVNKFIHNNPFVLNKKIVLTEVLEITDYMKLMELMYEYNDIVDKVYVNLVDNINYVSLTDCYKTMSAIKKQADDIKALNLSEMETIMYVYDMVRNRIYNHEDDDESLFKSRDLTEVIFGDKIVCAGYANIFHTLLSYLGIKSGIVKLIDKNDKSGRTGHARNIVYVNDPKYDIDGVYYFDPTWDSRRENEDNKYLYRYNFFAQTRNQVDSDKRYHYEDTTFDKYSTDIYEKVEKIIKEGNYFKLTEYFKSINHMSFLVNKGLLLKALDVVANSPTYGCFNADEFLEKFKNISSKFNKEISAETFIKLLNNVRKIEYYQDPKWYLYSLDDIYKTIIKSNWKFKNDNVNESTRLLLTIFGQKGLDTKDLFIEYIRSNDLLREIEQVKLTRILKKELENKSK